MNASADLTVSFFRAPVRGASPSYIRALVSAVLPLHSLGVPGVVAGSGPGGGPADSTAPVMLRSAVKMAAMACRARFGLRATGRERPALDPRGSAKKPYKALDQSLLVTAAAFPSLQHKRGPLRTSAKRLRQVSI